MSTRPCPFFAHGRCQRDKCELKHVLSNITSSDDMSTDTMPTPLASNDDYVKIEKQTINVPIGMYVGYV
jgi:hypothetical protein